MVENKNYCVIMGGGIGSRFWPSSRENKPKQFLDIFGTGRSLLRMTFDRFARFIPTENILVVTGEVYRDQVLEQLPELKVEQVLLEPIRRNTAPCIAYACYHIKARDPKANIIVSPSDHLILDEEAFVSAMQEALAFVDQHPQLVTLGITPSRPETGYGYIQYRNEGHIGRLYPVKTFTEKPNREMAEIFLSSGEFLWNSGMFVWNVQTILSSFRQHLPELCALFDMGEAHFATEGEHQFIQETFPHAPGISIDYGVMEKADNVYVLPVSCGWADLGTWGSVYELKDKDETGNVVLQAQGQFYDATGNIVYTDDPSKLIVVQGIDDCIIAESQHVLLICQRSQEQRIKEFMSDASQLYDKLYD